MITTDTNTATIHIEDIGVTVRTLLAVAADGYKVNPKRVWKISYGDSNVVIGSVRIRTKELT
jgi:hypothetical protein